MHEMMQQAPAQTPEQRRREALMLTPMQGEPLHRFCYREPPPGMTLAQLSGQQMGSMTYQGVQLPYLPSLA